MFSWCMMKQNNQGNNILWFTMNTLIIFSSNFETNDLVWTHSLHWIYSLASLHTNLCHYNAILSSFSFGLPKIQFYCEALLYIYMKQTYPVYFIWTLFVLDLGILTSHYLDLEGVNNSSFEKNVELVLINLIIRTYRYSILYIQMLIQGLTMHDKPLVFLISYCRKI
jgi:hypothetical protein